MSKIFGYDVSEDIIIFALKNNTFYTQLVFHKKNVEKDRPEAGVGDDDLSDNGENSEEVIVMKMLTLKLILLPTMATIAKNTLRSVSLAMILIILIVVFVFNVCY